jgi:hypothetical protein
LPQLRCAISQSFDLSEDLGSAILYFSDTPVSRKGHQKAHEAQNKSYENQQMGGLERAFAGPPFFAFRGSLVFDYRQNIPCRIFEPGYSMTWTTEDSSFIGFDVGKVVVLETDSH